MSLCIFSKDLFLSTRYAKRDSNHCIKLTVNDISTLLDMQRSLVLNKKEVANGILPITQDVTDQGMKWFLLEWSI